MNLNQIIEHVGVDEVFLPIRDYENLYHISNFGRVKTLGGGQSQNPTFKKPRILRLYRAPNDYLFVKLCKNGKSSYRRIHRLVVETFLPNPLNLPQINHKNQIKTDNRLENLEWCDGHHNMNSFYKNKNTTSSYPGVHWSKKELAWIAHIRIKGRVNRLGKFKVEKDAALAYQKKLKTLRRNNVAG